VVLLFSGGLMGAPDYGPFRRNNEATGRKSTADVTRQKVEREEEKKTLS
jgi:hypothetical protein